MLRPVCATQAVVQMAARHRRRRHVATSHIQRSGGWAVLLMRHWHARVDAWLYGMAIYIRLLHTQRPRSTGGDAVT